MKSLLLTGTLALVWACGLPLAALNHQDGHQTFPNFDKRQAALRQVKSLIDEPAAKSLITSSGLAVEINPLFGTARHVSAKDGFLTGPAGFGKNLKALQTQTPSNDPYYPIKAFLDHYALLFGQGSEILQQAKIAKDYTTPHNGLRTVVWEQNVNGIRIFNGRLVGHITRHGELVNLFSEFLPKADIVVQKSLGNSKLAPPSTQVSAAQAVVLAAKNVGENAAPVVATANLIPNQTGTDTWQKFRGQGLKGDAFVDMVWMPLNRETVRLCWEVLITKQSSGEAFRVLIDSDTGEVWFRQSLTRYATPASYRVYTTVSPTPMSPGHTTPSSAQPPEVPRELITLTALNTNASPAGWINDDVFETRGNNVDAHLDRDANNQPDLPRPTATNRVFDFPLSLTDPPTGYTNASVVNLFYWCNWMHDQLYDLGFTEAAGNFQQDNFGRGGQGNDPVQADAQDGDGYNNANFATYPDGISPRMQMFIFNGPSPARDGSLDAHVVLHEYTHGLSERLVGHGAGIYALQSQGLAEGWSDFYALALTSSENDDLGANYPFAAYVSYRFYGLNENYYYGIRRYPYSTNLTKNPLTFKDIDPTKASSHFGIPRNPVLGSSASEVHSQGEVWAAMLWDMRANLIQKHGFATGNRLALQLVTDGLRLSPSNPTFLQARDAILQAELVNTGGANRAEVWAAFAKRGLGFFAICPPNSTTTGVVEDYSMPDDLMVAPAAGSIISGQEGGPFTPQTIIFGLTNLGSSPLPWTATASGLLSLSQYSGTLEGNLSGIAVTATVEAVVQSLPPGQYIETISFTNQLTGIRQPRTVVLRVGQDDFLVEFFDASDFDLQYSSLTFTPDGSSSFYSVCRQDYVEELPTDPSGGIVLNMLDDDYVQIPLTNGASVALFNERKTNFWICSNGHLDLKQGNTNYFEPELDVFFEQARAAALYADLNPAAGGTISYKQLSNRVAVTWEAVPEYGIFNQNTFQIELFFDGTVRMTWLRVDARNADVGMVRGLGIPAGIIESDFTTYPSCQPRLALSIPNSAKENAGLLAQAGRVTLPMPVASSVFVSLESFPPGRVGTPAMVEIPAGQIGADFDLQILDNALLDGGQTIRLTASASGYNPASARILIEDNETNSISLSLPDSAIENSGLLANAGRVNLAFPPDQSVLVFLSSSNTNDVNIPPPGWLIIPANQTSAVFNLEIINNNLLDRSRIATISARVPGWGEGSASLTIEDDENATLYVSLPPTLNESLGIVTNAAKVYVAAPLTRDLDVALSTSDATELIAPAHVIIPSGQTSAWFNLTVVDDPEIDGPQVVFVTASAAGYTNGQAATTINDNEVPPLPLRPNPLHGASNVPLSVTLSWLGGSGELLLNGDFETGDFTGWTTEGSATGSFVINNGSFVPPGGEPACAPLAGQFEAMSQQTGYGKRAIWQGVVVPPDAADVTLSWTEQVRNLAPQFSASQQFRVEIRNNSNEVLAIPYITGESNQLLGEPTPRSISLNPWRGQTIRIAFVEEDSLGCLNVHLDNISARATPPMETRFDVYLSTTTNLGPETLIGSTTNTFLTLTQALAPNTTYYWKVAAWRSGITSNSAIWSFTTESTNPRPGITLTSPADYSWFTAPPAIDFSAVANSLSGVSNIEFIANGARLGIVPGSSTNVYNFSWVGPGPGLFSITAVLYDNSGITVTSRPINVIVVQSGGTPVMLIPAGSEWLYLDDGSNQGTPWRAPDFDDSTWKRGRAEFGYGDGDEVTQVDYGPDYNNKYITTYFRKAFTNRVMLSSLAVKILRDDGAVVYLNGVEVFRSNMPFFNIGFNTRASADVTGAAETNFFTYNISPAYVLNGRNVIAVEVHQFTNNSPDLSFNLSLEGVGNYVPTVSMVSPANMVSLPFGQPVTLQAAAADTYGIVTNVEFYANGIKIGQRSSPPYSMQWLQPPVGTHSITAVAIDNEGASSSATPVTITVVAPSLDFRMEQSKQFQLTWPEWASNFVLEATPSLVPPAWTPVTNTPQPSNGRLLLQLPATYTNLFLRLRYP